MSVATREVSPLQDTSKSVVALLLSLSPAYFLLGARSKLGIDNLHVGLIQVVLLLVLRSLLDVLPSFRTVSPQASSPPFSVSASLPSQKAPTEEVTTQTVVQEIPVVNRKAIRSRRTKLRPLPSSPPPPFPVEKLDENVANFISTVEPSFLPHLPTTKPSTKIPPASLSTWTNLFEQDSITVLQHPTIKTLYGIGAHFPDVPLKKLYEVLIDLGSRATWDSMTSGADEIERFEVGGKKGNVSHMKMKGMPLVKAKDLVLLSVPGRLPQAEDEIPTAGPVAEKLRIYCASTSVEHERAAITPAFNRMELSVSGFLIEEDGEGSRIVQITDLSGLGSWVPNAVFKTVTQTMLPKSLVKLGETARGVTKEADSWPPPLLGSTSVAPELPAADVDSDSASEDLEEDSDDDDVDEASSTPPTTPPSSSESVALSPSASRDVYALLSQLRSLTSRLSALESIVTKSSIPSPSNGVPINRPWYSFSSSKDKTAATGEGSPTAGADLMTLSASKLSLLMTIGSAAGAAVALAAVSAWGRRRM
ncbi:uncharacterized protein JCM6883_000559 [Sporobolomyces salmoneus]|uniref:uncharacterized protein n=1 Tax=Sporobolomyces salmoneus TaxID=183962 RepID=UPI00317D1836